MKKINFIIAGNTFVCFLYFTCLVLHYLNLSDLSNFICDIILILSLVIKYSLLWEILIARFGKLKFSYIIVSIIEYIITICYILGYKFVINEEHFENYILNYCFGFITFGFLVSISLGLLEIHANKK